MHTTAVCVTRGPRPDLTILKLDTSGGTILREGRQNVFPGRCPMFMAVQSLDDQLYADDWAIGSLRCPEPQVTFIGTRGE